MIEKQHIKNKDVWIKVAPWHIQRDNPNIIPTEYFIASYYFDKPANDAKDGETITDEEGKTKLFESPVAALSHAVKKLKDIL